MSRNYVTFPCKGCGKPVAKRNGNVKPYCPGQLDCAMAYARWWAHENVDKVGDCEVWRGNQKGNEQFRIRIFIDGKRYDPRVLDLRSGAENASNRRYLQKCETPKCVNPDHWEVQVSTTRNLPADRNLIRAKLPAQPLVDYYDKAVAPLLMRNDDEHLVVKRAHREAITRGRRRGWFTVTTADELCIDVLRVHPSLIYGDLFYEAS